MLTILNLSKDRHITERASHKTGNTPGTNLIDSIGYAYYNSTTRRAFVRTPDMDTPETKVWYTYDELGRLKTVEVDKRNGVAPTPGSEEITTYDYNPVGSIEKITHSVGATGILTSDYDYDALNRLKNLVNKNSSAQTLSSFTYNHYADGQRKSVTEVDGTVINWTYDNLNRLTDEVYDAPGTTNDYTNKYVYDLVCNRRYIKDASNQVVVEYSYNDLDQLVLEDCTTGQDYTYEYDENGSLKRKYYGTTSNPYNAYVYDLQNRLVTFTPNGGSIVIYKYNSDGIRVEKKVGSGNPVQYLIDPYNHTGYAQVLKETRVGANSVVYIIGSDILAQATGSANPVYLLYDGHGSVRQLADNSGALVSGQVFDYDGYGNLFGSPSPQTNLLYVGEMFDSSLGWYYNRARYYNPLNGRSNQTDRFAGSYQDPISLHKYLYCHANPVNRLDPSGEFSLSEINVTQVIQTTLRTIGSGLRFAATHQFATSTTSKMVLGGVALGDFALAGYSYFLAPTVVVFVDSEMKPTILYNPDRQTIQNQVKIFEKEGKKLATFYIRSHGTEDFI